MRRKGLSISCGSCQQSWVLDVDSSLYLRLDIATRPCPLCGECTLACQDHDVPEAGASPLPTVNPFTPGRVSEGVQFPHR